MKNFLTQNIPAGNSNFPVWFIGIGILIFIGILIITLKTNKHAS